MALRESLAVALGDVLGEPVGELVQLSAGAHRETWSLRTASGERLIAQLLPASDELHAGIEMEAGVLRAAAAAEVPVAAVRAAVPAGGVLGGAALVLSFVEGEALAPRIMREPRFGSARRGLARQCGEILARVHAIPPGSVLGLSFADPIDRCYEVLDRLGAVHPAFELVLRRLSLVRPAPREPVVVHGDFRLGNLMLDEHGVAAVLDWELAHLGDPLEDLGWLCVPAWRFGGAQPVAGVGPYEVLLDAYAAAGGGSVSLGELLWWQAASTVWWGVLCLVQAERHRSGETRSVELAAIGRRACEQEWDALAVLEQLA